MNWQAIRDQIKQNVTGLGERVYMRRAIQDTEKPYCVVFKVSDPRGEMGTKRPRYQFSIFDTSYGRGRDIADEIKDQIKLLDGTVDIFAPFNEDDRELHEEETGLFHFQIDAIFYYDTGETW